MTSLSWSWAPPFPWALPLPWRPSPQTTKISSLEHRTAGLLDGVAPMSEVRCLGFYNSVQLYIWCHLINGNIFLVFVYEASGSTSNSLMEAKMNNIANTECSNRWSGVSGASIFSSHICLYEEGKSACSVSQTWVSSEKVCKSSVNSIGVVCDSYFWYSTGWQRRTLCLREERCMDPGWSDVMGHQHVLRNLPQCLHPGVQLQELDSKLPVTEPMMLN